MVPCITLVILLHRSSPDLLAIFPQVLYLYHSFCEAVDSQKKVRVKFCDLSKAFSKESGIGIFFSNFHSVDINANMLQWFSSYLSNRTQ